MNDVTQILGAMQRGDPKAASELLPQVYQELRRLATYRMKNELPGQTLQPTALVHEAWLKLAGANGEAQFQNRAHFFGAAAEAMRQILIDRARRKQAQKRGAGIEHVDVDELEICAPAADEELLAMSAALDRFAITDPPKAQVVKLRYFVGMTNEEVAEIMGISEPTAKRWWAYARAWLFAEIRGKGVANGETRL